MTEEWLLSDKEYLEIRRRALLMELEIIEKRLGTSPKTCELRKWYKHGTLPRVDAPIDNQECE